MAFPNSILRKARGYLQRKVFASMGLTHRLSSGYIIHVSNKMEWIIYNDIFVEGDYDEGILNTLRWEEQNINILDLGGNVGYFELRIAHLLMSNKINKTLSICVVEGSQRLCDELKMRTQQLSSSFNISIHHGLAGLRTGKGTLYEFDQHGLNSMFRRAGRPIDVRYLDIAKLCQHWEKIHLVKIDIEGSELIFLQQYPDILTKARAIIVELHPEFCDTLACQELLKEHGFTIHKVVKDYGNCSVHLFSRP